MQGVPDHFDHPHDTAEFRRPVHSDSIELYRAHIVRHAFEPHAHDGFGLGAIDSGCERFRYRGADHLAGAGSLVLMNPHELHTGRAETDGGWRYRMIYIDEAAMQKATGESGWSFRDVVTSDEARATRVSSRLRALWACTGEPLAFDSHLMALLAELRPLARVGRPADAASSLAGSRIGPGRGRDASLDRAMERLAASLDEPLTLETLAAVAGLSPFQLLRRFKAAHHVTPHQWRMARRLDAAKRRLADGEAPASVAAAVGLADQAHLTHAFRNRYGTTPGRYRQQVAGTG